MTKKCIIIKWEKIPGYYDDAKTIHHHDLTCDDDNKLIDELDAIDMEHDRSRRAEHILKTGNVTLIEWSTVDGNVATTQVVWL